MSSETANEPTTPLGLKAKIWNVLDGSNTEPGIPLATNVALLVLILANVAAVVLETVETIDREWSAEFYVFEVVSVVVFSVEYLLRLWSCGEEPKFRGLLGRLRWMITPMALVDLAAVLPFYLPMLVVVDMRFVRALRLLRLFRLFKASQYTRSFGVMGRVLFAKRQEITITLFSITLGLLIASSLVYYVEHDAQPEAFSSIPAALWWGVATLSTVGYGDIYPVTALGRILAAITALFGIGLFGMPAAILADGFRNEMEAERAGKTPAPDPWSREEAAPAEVPAGPAPSGACQACPHCGGSIAISFSAALAP